MTQKKHYQFILLFIYCISSNLGYSFSNVSSAFDTLISDSYLFNCSDPTDLEVGSIGDTHATIHWKDSANTTWEYYVQPMGSPLPTKSGVPTSTRTNNITTDVNGNTLAQNTQYEFFVRSICNGGTEGQWIGPISFKTHCSIVALPFLETVEPGSDTVFCWFGVDNNEDGTATTNKWRIENTANHAYAGTSSLYFNGTNTGKTHDDYIVSPPFQVNAADLYEVIFYYKTTSTASTEFEIVLSDSGLEPADFTTIVSAKEIYKTAVYKKKTVYIENISGTVYLGWHVLSKGASPLYLDNISIKKVSCKAPLEDVIVVDRQKDNVTFQINDPFNSQWDYIVGVLGSGSPNSGGVSTLSKTINVTRSSIGQTNSLVPDTEYELWFRSSCGVGKYSSWIGPISFRTTCDIQPFPFVEGFNKNSQTIQCWKVVDVNKDAAISSNTWLPSTAGPYEGDQMMYFNGFNFNATQLPHNDWLISPTFQFNPNKYYRLTYSYKTSGASKIDYNVLLSNGDDKLTSFTRTIATKKEVASTTWKQETIIIGGASGIGNLAWQVVSTTGNSPLAIDQVMIEEIDCSEPYDFTIKDEKQAQVTLSWADDYGTQWEYVVQDIGGGVPISGVSTTTSTPVVTQLYNGNPLIHSTEYEYYVRTVCGTTTQGKWFGPIKFKTTCGIYTAPFWEGFNNGSKSLSCWTIVDSNQDSTTPTGTNIWKNNTVAYEGSGAMLFQGLQNNKTKLPHNDWLISPTIQLDPNKTYRLKYHYKILPTITNEYEFEVLLSKNGVDVPEFTTTILPRKKYNPNPDWQQEYLFITGISGTINLGWHVTSNTPSTYLLLDNLFLEEVIGCAEPIELTVTTVGTKTATLEWVPALQAANFEYYVQQEGMGVPTTSGTATTSSSVSITTEQNGTGLLSNQKYEFYVRTACGNGVFSIWNGPYSFETTCEAFTIPYQEGFNYVENTFKCWSVVDGNVDATLTNNKWFVHTNLSNVYEGNQAMYFYGTSNKKHNDWLISPTLSVTSGLYMLRYFYKTSTLFNNEFEVLLSTNGTAIDQFVKPIVASRIYKNGGYVEEVAYFTVSTGDINVGWHVTSTGTTHVYVDTISIKKIENCAEPYHIKTTNHNSTGFDISWSQYGTVASWEVLVVGFGELPTAMPIQQFVVTNTPEATITGLIAGQAYTVYVRSLCDNKLDYSLWSDSATTATLVGANDECSGAVALPVNQTVKCDQTVSGSLNGATTSANVRPGCYATLKNDVWYEFTATATEHVLSAPLLRSLTNGSATIVISLYDQNCQGLTANALQCFGLTTGETTNYKVLSNLLVGQKYLLRVGLAPFATDLQVFFNLCITTPNSIYISKNGDDYQLEELVQDVFTNTTCKLVSNIRYQNGDGSALAQDVNTLGYFNKANSIFPFDEGIVLSTGEVEYAKGPFTIDNKGDNSFRWTGDKDLLDAINDTGGMPSTPKLAKDMRVTQLSFDLIPMKDSIHFEYLFASNSYLKDCDYACNNGALFAAWLVDKTTGEGKNLAKIRGTEQPIALNTILDGIKTGGNCESVNEEYYWNHYLNNQVNPIEAPFNFVGSTIALTSETVGVIPGRTYYIKLAVMDFCVNKNHTSAVFFNGGSFDLGTLNLGEDKLVSTNNALCFGETTTIQSGFKQDNELNMVIEWYKDSELVVGQTLPDLTVSEPGDYEIKIQFPDLECEFSGTIKVEYYPDIKLVVHEPEVIEVCQNAITDLIVDLTQVEKQMLRDVDSTQYSFTYYRTEQEALEHLGAIEVPTQVNIGKHPQTIIYYIALTDIRTSCTTVFSLYVVPQVGEVPTPPESEKVCAVYVFAPVAANQYYYTKPNAEGIEYKAGDVLETPGLHTIYFLQINNELGCFEETTFEIAITEQVKADVFENQILSCAFFVLPELSTFNKYYTQSNAKGDQLQVGDVIHSEQTIYIYAESLDGLCTDQSSFTVTYEDCPIPKGISPNMDGLNDSFDLSLHGVSSIKIFNRLGVEVYSHSGKYTNQWNGKDKSGHNLPSGTYFYVIHAFERVRTGWVELTR